MNHKESFTTKSAKNTKAGYSFPFALFAHFVVNFLLLRVHPLNRKTPQERPLPYSTPFGPLSIFDWAAALPIAIAIITISPNMRPRSCIDKLSCDPQPRAGLPNTSFKDVRDVKSAAYLQYVNGFALVSEHGISSYHRQP